jgi:tetratricopeptide (TPR) repeat protein
MPERWTTRSRNDAARARAEFVRVSSQFAQERHAAAAIVESTCRDPFEDRPRIPEEWVTAGFVDVLASAAHDLLAVSPDRAAALAALATRIAARLDDRSPRILRAQCTKQAWLELSEAHRCQGEHEGALRALDRAERAIRDELVLAHDRATVDLARARVFRELGRLPEALELVSDATKIFFAHGDRVRAGQCERLRADMR